MSPVNMSIVCLLLLSLLCGFCVTLTIPSPTPLSISSSMASSTRSVGIQRRQAIQLPDKTAKTYYSPIFPVGIRMQIPRIFNLEEISDYIGMSWNLIYSFRDIPDTWIHLTPEVKPSFVCRNPVYDGSYRSQDGTLRTSTPVYVHSPAAGCRWQVSIIIKPSEEYNENFYWPLLAQIAQAWLESYYENNDSGDNSGVTFLPPLLIENALTRGDLEDSIQQYWEFYDPTRGLELSWPVEEPAESATEPSSTPITLKEKQASIYWWYDGIRVTLPDKYSRDNMQHADNLARKYAVSLFTKTGPTLESMSLGSKFSFACIRRFGSNARKETIQEKGCAWRTSFFIKFAAERAEEVYWRNAVEHLRGLLNDEYQLDPDRERIVSINTVKSKDAQQRGTVYPNWANKAGFPWPDDTNEDMPQRTGERGNPKQRRTLIQQQDDTTKVGRPHHGVHTVFPVPSSTCPRSSLDQNGKSYTQGRHCTWRISKIKPTDKDSVVSSCNEPIKKAKTYVEDFVEVGDLTDRGLDRTKAISQPTPERKNNRCYPRNADIGFGNISLEDSADWVEEALPVERASKMKRHVRSTVQRRAPVQLSPSRSTIYYSDRGMRMMLPEGYLREKQQQYKAESAKVRKDMTKILLEANIGIPKSDINNLEYTVGFALTKPGHGRMSDTNRPTWRVALTVKPKIQSRMEKLTDRKAWYLFSWQIKIYETKKRDGNLPHVLVKYHANALTRGDVSKAWIARFGKETGLEWPVDEEAVQEPDLDDYRPEELDEAFADSEMDMNPASHHTVPDGTSQDETSQGATSQDPTSQDPTPQKPGPQNAPPAPGAHGSDTGDIELDIVPDHTSPDFSLSNWAMSDHPPLDDGDSSSVISSIDPANVDPEHWLEAAIAADTISENSREQADRDQTLDPSVHQSRKLSKRADKKLDVRAKHVQPPCVVDEQLTIYFFDTGMRVIFPDKHVPHDDNDAYALYLAKERSRIMGYLRDFGNSEAAEQAPGFNLQNTDDAFSFALTRRGRAAATCTNRGIFHISVLLKSEVESDALAIRWGSVAEKFGKFVQEIYNTDLGRDITYKTIFDSQFERRGIYQEAELRTMGLSKPLATSVLAEVILANGIPPNAEME